MNYQLKGVYLFQTATVTKLLREGWEPFWGYRCTHEHRDTVRMYFRKAPDPIVTELQALESEPPVVQIDMSNVSEFIQQLNMILNKLPERIAEKINQAQQLPMRAGGILEAKKVQPEHGSENEAVNKEVYDMDKNLDEAIDRRERKENKEAEEIEIDVREELNQEESPTPAGDGFKIVEEVPADLPVRAKTDKQISIIEQLRNTSEFNITVFPVDDQGNVKIFKGDDIITVKPDGSLSKERNPANRDSTAV